MRARLTVVFGLLLLGGCGFAPKPQNGLLPCDEGCPDGYVCRTDNRCWLPGTPAADSAIGQPPVSYDGAALEAAVDLGRAGEVAQDVAMDATAVIDGTVEHDYADSGKNRDGLLPAVDAPEGTGGGSGMDSGAGGAGGMDSAAGGAGGSVGSGGAVTGSGGAVPTGGSVVVGTGGATTSGGTSAVGTGGVSATGGAVISTGGVIATGGIIATGGAVATGGTIVGTGGTISGSGGAMACVPDTDKQCSDATHIRTCGSDGKWGTPTGCPYVCVDNPGNTDACGGVCVPTTDKQCADATHLRTCGADGQWPTTGTLCQFACVDGPGTSDACGGVCVPGTDTKCADATHLQTCGTDGQWPTTGTLCPYVCVDNPGTTDACGGVCVPSVDKQCSDSTHYKICGTNGEWPTGTGVPCTTNYVCRSADCVNGDHYAGNRSALGTDVTVSTGTLYIFRMQPLAHAAVITALGAYGKVAGATARLVVYADNGGSPARPNGAPITATNGVVVLYDGAEEKTVDPANQQLAAGQYYWIGIEFSQTTTFRTAANSGQQGYRYSHDFSSSTYPTISTAGAQQNFADWAVFIRLQDLE